MFEGKGGYFKFSLVVAEDHQNLVHGINSVLYTVRTQFNTLIRFNGGINFDRFLTCRA